MHYITGTSLQKELFEYSSRPEMHELFEILALGVLIQIQVICYKELKNQCCGSGPGGSVINLSPGSGSINSELRIYKKKVKYFIFFNDLLPI